MTHVLFHHMLAAVCDRPRSMRHRFHLECPQLNLTFAARRQFVINWPCIHNQGSAPRATRSLTPSDLASKSLT